MNGTKHKVLIFIGSLQCGGKERRLIELLTYLKSHSEIEFLVVVTRDKVHYKSFFDLNIAYHVIPKARANYDLSIFRKFHRICKNFRPDVIHTWGKIQTLYALPAAKLLKIPLCNSQITTGQRMPENFLLRLIDRINFRFSDVILSNSFAGVRAFQPPKEKTRVIYNGMNLERFENLPSVGRVKCRHDIKTSHAVVMAASFNANKDYDRFYRVAALVTKQNEDVTFIGVGDFNKENDYYLRIKDLSKNNDRILFPGKVQDIEALVNVCTVGVLFSPFGEGLSNAILEYMALGKPVVATDCAGNSELIRNNVNGYLVNDESDEEVAAKIMNLIGDPETCEAFGRFSKAKIHQSFSNDNMGEAFRRVYNSIVGDSIPQKVPAMIFTVDMKAKVAK